MLIVTREFEQALAAPDACGSCASGVMPIHHSKRRVNEFAQERLIEFRNYAPQFGMVDNRLHSPK